MRERRDGKRGENKKYEKNQGEDGCEKKGFWGENRTIKGKMNVKTIERVFSLSN